MRQGNDTEDAAPLYLENYRILLFEAWQLALYIRRSPHNIMYQSVRCSFGQELHVIIVWHISNRCK